MVVKITFKMLGVKKIIVCKVGRPVSQMTILEDFINKNTYLKFFDGTKIPIHNITMVSFYPKGTCPVMWELTYGGEIMKLI